MSQINVASSIIKSKLTQLQYKIGTT